MLNKTPKEDFSYCKLQKQLIKKRFPTFNWKKILQ